MPRDLEEEQLEEWRETLRSISSGSSPVTILGSDGRRSGLRQNLPELIEEGVIQIAPELSEYASSRNASDENLGRLAAWIAATHLGRDEIELQEAEVVVAEGLHHPDHPELFGSAAEFEAWRQVHTPHLAEDAPRVLIATPFVHLQGMNREVVAALIRAAEERGAVAAAVVERSAPHEQHTREFQPDVVLHLFTSQDSAEFRLELDVPHMMTSWLRRGTLEDWLTTPGRASDFPGLLIEEARGTIEPFFVAARRAGAESRGEPMQPILDRVERAVERAVGWAKLARKSRSERRVALLFGVAERGAIGIGTADSRQLDLPESLARVLSFFGQHGYHVEGAPSSGVSMVEALADHSRSPAEMDREADVTALQALASRTDTVLFPVDEYLQWLEVAVPASRRDEVESEFGAAPGRLGLVRNAQGVECFVISCLDYGGLLVVPKPSHAPPDGLEEQAKLRGEEAERARIVPSHAFLATYAWLQTAAELDALMVWGSFGIDLLLPEKKAGLRAEDWPDILMGSLPNVRPWSAQAMHFSMLARRRTYSALVGLASPPLGTTALDPELERLGKDLIKWPSLSDGAAREQMRESVTRVVREQSLDLDLQLELREGALLSDLEMERLAMHLDNLRRTPVEVRRRVIGESPKRADLIPYLLLCAGDGFLDLLALRPGAARDSVLLEQQAERLIDLVAFEGLSVAEGIARCGLGEGPPDLKLVSKLEQVHQLAVGYGKLDQELTGLLHALDGGFVAPGPGGEPHQNPAVIPTGRNLYALHPDELPTQSAYALGSQLIEELIVERGKESQQPHSMAFVLSPRSTLRDFGVVESQILRAIGVEPIWDSSGQVHDVRLISVSDLGRPRMDVVVQVSGFYLEHFGSRMELLDLALRRVAEAELPGNPMRQKIEAELHLAESRGEDLNLARRRATARLFSVDPSRFASGTHDKFFEATDLWHDRSELTDLWLDRHGYAYTEGYWGVRANDAHRERLRGADVVVRAMNKRGALAGRAHHDGGSLSMAIESLAGRRPEYYLSDLRFPGRARNVEAIEAVRLDARATLLNRDWAESMMEQGYAGAAEMAKLTEKLLGWSTSRSGEMGADLYDRAYAIYIEDAHELGLERWFAEHNPFAHRELAEALLEATRKGFWQAAPGVSEALESRIESSKEEFGPSLGGVSSVERPSALVAGPELITSSNADLLQEDDDSSPIGSLPLAWLAAGLVGLGFLRRPRAT